MIVYFISCSMTSHKCLCITDGTIVSNKITSLHDVTSLHMSLWRHMCYPFPTFLDDVTECVVYRKSRSDQQLGLRVWRTLTPVPHPRTHHMVAGTDTASVNGVGDADTASSDWGEEAPHQAGFTTCIAQGEPVDGRPEGGPLERIPCGDHLKPSVTPGWGAITVAPPSEWSRNHGDDAILWYILYQWHPVANAVF